MRTPVSALFIAALTACGGGDTAIDAPHSDATHDAPHVDAPHIDSAIDGPPPTVLTVACGSATPVATVADSNFAYTSTPQGSASNDSAIKTNDVVEFNLNGLGDHPMVPDPGTGSAPLMTDSGLHAPDAAITCLKFTAPGTFHYKCLIHEFPGTVTVTN
jgi:plastocyanin